MVKLKPMLYLITTLFSISVVNTGSATNDESLFDADLSSVTITATTTDGITIFGEQYFADLDHSSPLILLFHQGRSNGRAEYGPLVDWLNLNGFRAIAWDQRSGGGLYGQNNRTENDLSDEAEGGYCAASADLQAALDYVSTHGLARRVIVWGSSYSGALVFRLAAENADQVAGLISFSPSSGNAVAECRASLSVKDVKAPLFVLRPASEMARLTSLQQKDILIENGAKFLTVENGIHGSSMLVDSRTEYDMSQTRETVLEWLKMIVRNRY